MRKTITAIATHRASRFGALGVVNTLLDFLILNILRVSSHTTDTQTRKLIVLNIVSASCVAVFSFFMNKKFVFQKQDTHHTKVWLFVAITLSGIFLLQSAVISITLPLIGPFASWLQSLFSHMPMLAGISTNFYSTNTTKVVATALTMIWNYTLYKKFVFRA